MPATQSSPSVSVTAAESSRQVERRKAFRALHERGCFVIPNPWDVGSARYLQHLGFPALATTSAGCAFSQGLPDSGDGSRPESRAQSRLHRRASWRLSICRSARTSCPDTAGNPRTWPRASRAAWRRVWPGCRSRTRRVIQRRRCTIFQGRSSVFWPRGGPSMTPAWTCTVDRARGVLPRRPS